MTALVLSDPVPAFENPELTAQKLARAWEQQIDWSQVRRKGAEERGKPHAPPPSPLLSAAEIERDHGAHTAGAPVWQLATFKIPLGIRWTAYETLRDEKAAVWVMAMAKDGWDLCSDSRIVAKPGPYPAHDLDTGLPMLGQREVILMARFRQRNPVLYTWELPRDWFERPA